MKKQPQLPTILFGSRRLKQYSTPVRTMDLKTNTVYFSLNFFDKDLLIPCLRPVIFVGQNLNPHDRGAVFYFQDLESHIQGLRYDHTKRTKSTYFYSGSEGELNYIFEYERGLEELMKCSLRRKRATL